MDFNATVIKRRLVEKLGPAESSPASQTASVSNTVDLAPLLAIADDAGFVRESYLRIFGRECDVGGFVHYRELLRNHFSRRSMILQLVESAEAKMGGRRYVGLWDRSQEASLGSGIRWVSAFKLALWKSSRRVFEFLLRVSRVESIELKLDYVMRESALHAERNIAKLDHTLFSISDKVDRYVADLVVKQAELTALVRENGVQQAMQAHASLLRQTALTEDMRLLCATLTDSARHHNAQLDQLRLENQLLRDSIADIRRQQRSPVFQAGADVIVTEVEGFLLGVPSQEWRLGAYYALRGLPEPGMTRLFASLIQPGMVVVDIGAHIGIYTLFALRHLSGHGRLYSFEPTPKTHALLRDNVQVNGFLESGVVRLDSRALSDHAGTATFTAYPNNSGHNSLFSGTTPGETLTVETVTLDAALAAEPRIDVIKIDAEGSEPFVLRGMTRILATSPGLRIFVEFAPEHLRRAGIEPLQWYEELIQLGLQVRRVEDASGELLAIDPESLALCTSWNLLLSK